MYRFLQTKFKIGVALLFAMILATTLNRTIFIASSPRINQQFIASIRNFPQTIQNTQNTMFAFLQHPADSTARNTQIIQSQLANAPTPAQNILFTPVSKGVYAAEDPKTKQKMYKIDKGTVVQIRKIKLSNGREFTIIIPP